MDFTFNSFSLLIQSLLSQGFSFLTLNAHFKNKLQIQESALNSNSNGYHRTIVLRHDVEAKYQNAIHFAEIQHKMNIKGSYYFRIIKGKFEREIISKIAGLGHEIGYHYDDLSFYKGDHKAAIQRFEKHLNLLREIAPVQTITMEGAPLSKYDNKDLWKHYNYRDYGIIAEPYFDLSFGTEFSQNKIQSNEQESRKLAVGSGPPDSYRDPKPQISNTNLSAEALAKEEPQTSNFFYLTDTGRRWDGWRVSVRDKVPQQEKWIKQGLVFRSTHDIITAASEGRLPDKIMMTFHPQRWNDKPLPWIKEWIAQSMKNQVKRILVAKQK